MKLTKIHSNDCEVCVSIGSQAKALADDNNFEYEEIQLEHFASDISPLRDYVIDYYVTPNDGMIDLPIYLISTDQGEIQGSSLIQDLEQVSNLIYSWKSWASLVKPSSAE
tara:strand:- start:180 stop:509 length:330 start_codon:yes stop_codon:yes gene_type:complete